MFSYADICRYRHVMQPRRKPKEEAGIERTVNVNKYIYKAILRPLEKKNPRTF